MLMNTKLACTERNNMLYFSIIVSNRQIIIFFSFRTTNSHNFNAYFALFAKSVDQTAV